MSCDDQGARHGLAVCNRRAHERGTFGPMPTTRRAVRDEQMAAVMTARAPLTYAAGADAALDRPAHVRAASGIAWLGGRLAVVQDDASFVALVDLARGLEAGARAADVIALP